MAGFRVLPIALIALLVPSVVAAAVPTPPVVPAIPLPPGSKSARFKVVVEGTATAVKEEAWSGLIPCVVSITARVEETTTYRRGRGVLMEFVRLGPGRRAPIVIQRVGRRFDASLSLRLSTVVTSEGSASRQNPPSGGVCDPRTEDLSQGPDCAGRTCATGTRGCSTTARGASSAFS